MAPVGESISCRLGLRAGLLGIGDPVALQLPGLGAPRSPRRWGSRGMTGASPCATATGQGDAAAARPARARRRGRTASC
jgi:hypothetical protein